MTTTHGDTERKLRDALEKAQKELKAAEMRLKIVQVEARKQEALVRASFEPTQLEAKAAQERFDELKASTERQARELTAAWKREVELRELEIQRLQVAMLATRPAALGELRCGKCGSSSIIPEVGILDRYASSLFKPLTAAVAGDPGAWFNREVQYSNMRVHVCGDCGYCELYTTDGPALHAAYVNSLQRSVAGLSVRPRHTLGSDSDVGQQSPMV